MRGILLIEGNILIIDCISVILGFAHLFKIGIDFVKSKISRSMDKTHISLKDGGNGGSPRYMAPECYESQGIISSLSSDKRATFSKFRDYPIPCCAKGFKNGFNF